MNKVAILLPSLKFGGAERVSITLARQLKEADLAIEFVLMSKEGELLNDAASEFNIRDLRCRRTYQLPMRLHGYLRESQPDVLICSFWKLNLCACLARLLTPKVKLLLWEHSPPSRSGR